MDNPPWAMTAGIWVILGGAVVTADCRVERAKRPQWGGDCCGGNSFPHGTGSKTSQDT